MPTPTPTPTPGLIRAALVTASVDTEHRTIEGIATFFGQAANASTGRVQFETGSLHLPEDLRRVKLCVDHDHTRAVGYCIDASIQGDQLRTKFQVPETPEGDEALASAANGLRDGLSVGAFPEPGGAKYLHGSQTLVITNAVVREVSLTALPAFDAARVATVKATTPDPSTPTTQEGTTHMDPEETTPETPETPTVEATTTQAPPVVTTRRAPATVEAAAQTVVRMLQDGATPGAVQAALQDVVPADDAGNGFIGRDTWLGQLWQARRVARPLIDSITTKPLGRTTKVKGWQWETRPTVAAYTGNKTAIASNKVKTKAIEASVERTAGGWDVDRIYVDLGDPDMLQALWEGALEDYLLKTEAKAATGLLAAASPVTATSTDLPAALVKLGLAAASQASSLNFVAFGADVWAAFTALTKDQIPWWITSGDALNLSTTSGQVNGLRLFVDPTIAGTTILAGDKRAAEWHEANPPVRVNAVNLPNGGVDLGLFGYHALLVNDPASLFKIEQGGGA